MRAEHTRVDDPDLDAAARGSRGNRGWGLHHRDSIGSDLPEEPARGIILDQRNRGVPLQSVSGGVRQRDCNRVQIIEAVMRPAAGLRQGVFGCGPLRAMVLNVNANIRGVQRSGRCDREKKRGATGRTS
jgi:hypothetical protein